MKFLWTMERDDWERLMHDNAQKDNPEFNIENDIYGYVNVGNIEIEIRHSLDNDDWYAYSNIYVLGVYDNDYYETKSGIPYALLEDDIAIPMSCNNFNEFKQKFELAITEFVFKHSVNVSLSVLANLPLAKWQ